MGVVKSVTPAPFLHKSGPFKNRFQPYPEHQETIKTGTMLHPKVIKTEHFKSTTGTHTITHVHRGVLGIHQHLDGAFHALTHTEYHGLKRKFGF